MVEILNGKDIDFIDNFVFLCRLTGRVVGIDREGACQYDVLL